MSRWSCLALLVRNSSIGGIARVDPGNAIGLTALPVAPGAGHGGVAATGRVRENRVATREGNGGHARASSPPHRDASLNEGIRAQIRVVLVDDHLAFRQALAFMLLREPDITISGQAGTVEEARPLLAAADIALIDLHLPDGDGMVLLHELHSLAPQAIAVVLTGDDSTAGDGPRGGGGSRRRAPQVAPGQRDRGGHPPPARGEPLVSLRESIELLRVSRGSGNRTAPSTRRSTG